MSESAPIAEDVPFPPRFRWLKRIAATIALLLLSLLALRLWWGHVADQRLQAFIDDCHARGEPILPEDFASPAIPEDQNAAVTLRRAAEAIVEGTAGPAWDRSTPDASHPGDWPTAREVLSQNRDPLALARHARSQSLADWHHAIAPGFTDERGAESTRIQQIKLASLLYYCGVYYHATGNDSEALEICADLLHQSQVIDHKPVSMGMHRTAQDIDRIAIELLRAAASKPSSPDSNPSEFNRQTAGSLVTQLLDDSGPTKSYILWRQAECASGLDLAKFLVNGQRLPQETETPPAYSRSWLFTPLTKLDAVNAFRAGNQVALAVNAPDLQIARASLPPMTQDSSVLSGLARPYSGLYGYVLVQPWLMEQHYQRLADRHLAAALLAIRLYRLDHQNRLPERLDDLVPKYFPAVPNDPMASGNRPVRYAPDRKPPIVYCLGAHGADHGGQSAPPGSSFNTDFDTVFEVVTEKPTTAPSSEAQQNQ